MKKLFLMMALLASVVTFTSGRATQAKAQEQLQHAQGPSTTYVGHWYYSVTNTVYHVYVYVDDPTSVAKVATDADGSVDATGTYDPDTKTATVLSSIINFSDQLSYP